MADAASAEAIIACLGLQPHPEGGWFAETYRDGAGGKRGHSTAIYFLLKTGEQSAWHRVRDAAEVWHFYAGAPLELAMADPDGRDLQSMTLGPDVVAGQRPQGIVPANHWQSAKSLGDWTLVGCTVSPGFEFAAFEMAPPDWQPAG